MNKLQKLLANMQKIQTFAEADKLIMEYATDKLNMPKPIPSDDILVRSISLDMDDPLRIVATAELILSSTESLKQNYWIIKNLMKKDYVDGFNLY